MTLTELTSAIQQFCECSETKFVLNINTFIRAAERRVFNNAQIPISRKSATLVSADTPTALYKVSFLLPSDFLAPYTMRAVQTNSSGVIYQVALIQKDIEFLLEAYPTLAAETLISVEDVGIPQYYAIELNFTTGLLGVRIAPGIQTNAGPSNTVMNYLALPQSLVDADAAASGTLTWLSTNYPEALLWGAIVEGYIFLKGEPNLIATYEGKFQDQLTMIKQMSDGKDRQDTYRVLQTRIPVT